MLVFDQLWESLGAVAAANGFYFGARNMRSESSKESKMGKIKRQKIEIYSYIEEFIMRLLGGRINLILLLQGETKTAGVDGWWGSVRHSSLLSLTMRLCGIHYCDTPS